ncbi:hypothetical protein EMIHUDRAFT_209254 [Emiliania huxleyi CCMP1516]|uniref:F-box domain-containing protein n=2 Tax=Emiliania huxleyi TaxID=2903 RepID=A0A0D3J7Y0_EMIH1|nr:hypothetical protein EMIHUDRAFT_209254 [Emiliania huxleyi CCMP1516]EOD19615.1 hypothetical protein EMIHUDRAFT_209254 [Emiliania huxleyi CCMP1516]|eukprot:XP_005772044.1 hypothetical protein EMIHUDRAFT_209254 [Emiliania huxleyi CCMP1516]
MLACVSERTSRDSDETGKFESPIESVLLSADLLPTIFAHLPLADYFHAASTCRDWQNAQAEDWLEEPKPFALCSAEPLEALRLLAQCQARGIRSARVTEACLRRLRSALARIKRGTPDTEQETALLEQRETTRAQLMAAAVVPTLVAALTEHAGRTAVQLGALVDDAVMRSTVNAGIVPLLLANLRHGGACADDSKLVLLRASLGAARHLGRASLLREAVGAPPLPSVVDALLAAIDHLMDVCARGKASERSEERPARGGSAPLPRDRATHSLWIDRVVRLLDATARFSDGAICIGSNGAMRAAVAASRAARLLLWLASSRHPTTATVSPPDDDRGTGLLIAEDHPSWLAVVLRRGGLEAVARNLLAAEARAERMRQGWEQKQWAGMRSHQCAPLRKALTWLVRREEEMGLGVGGTEGITAWQTVKQRTS